MAIGTPIERYTQAIAPAVIDHFTFSPASTVAAGTVAILLDSNDGTSSNSTVLSVSDTAGNTWTVDHAFNDATGARNVSIASCQVTTAITTGNTITITYVIAANVARSVSLYEVSGLATSSVFDTATDHAPTPSNGFSVGPTATLASANEIAFTICREGFTPATLTPGSGWTAVTTPVVGRAGIEYQIVSATTPLTGTGALSGSTDSGAVAVIAVYKGASAAVAPANTVAPVVTGTAKVGSVLTTGNGTWTGTPSPTFTYQWQRDNAGGGVYSNIASATAAIYTLVDADDACNVRCVVTGTNTSGSASANSNASAITEPAPTNSVAPVASGTVHVGSVLSATTGTWAHQGGTVATYTYQWQDSTNGTTGWANVVSATLATYTIGSGELTKFLRCNVTATNTGGTSTATSSNVLGAVTAAPAVSGPPNAHDTAQSAHDKLVALGYPESEATRLKNQWTHES